MLGAPVVSFPREAGAFFSEFYPRVHAYVCAASGADRRDVEDLVQETLLEAWRGRDRFRGDADPLTWVLGIARHRVLLRRRSQAVAGRHREDLAAAARTLDRNELPERLLQSEELRSLVREVLDEVGDAYARVLVLRYCDGLTVRDIARDLKESEKAVESRLHRARESFRDILRRRADDDRSE